MSKPFEYPWERVKPYKLYDFFMVIIRRLWTRVFFDVTVVGRENLPEDAGNYILASNHLHAIDPLFLATASHLRWRFIAKIELFRKSKLIAWFLTQCGGFPVDRGNADRRALDYSVAILTDGRAGLAIFPEGSRSLDGLPQEPKTGAVVIARRAKANIIPCSIWHEGDLKFRRKVTIRFGEVIPYEALDLGDTPNQRRTKAAAAMVMAEIVRLWALKDIV